MAYEEEVIFKFTEDHQVTYKLFSDGFSGSGLIIILPAMGVRASYYKRLARCIVEEKEKDVITLDYRGIGTSTVRADRSNKIGYQAIIDDLHEIINNIVNEKEYHHITLWGHSMGGQIAIMYGSRYSQLINHIITVGTSLPYYKEWPGSRKKWRRFAGITFYPLSQVMGYFPGGKFGFAGREGIHTMKDWCHLVNTGRLEPAGSTFDYNSAVENYPGRITAFSFTEDDMTPSETVSNLLKRFNKSSSVDHYIVEGFDHFNWSKSPLHIVKHYT
jgi:predicted alpha/beta hydrolase